MAGQHGRAKLLAPVVNIFLAPSKPWLALDVVAPNRLFIWPTHFSEALAIYGRDKV